MGTTLKVRLSTNSIDNALKQLEAYSQSIDDKNKMFVSELLHHGIEVAEHTSGIGGAFGTHKMENYVTFSMKLDSQKHGCSGVMLGVGKTFYEEWISKDGIRKGSINAMMALEFGTAAMALPAQTMFGVTGGKGTNSQYGHENESVWAIYVSDGVETKPKILTAITPSRPMYNAAMNMIQQIETIAMRVFQTNKVIEC